jgi:hypothetical protein
MKYDLEVDTHYASLEYNTELVCNRVKSMIACYGDI